MFYCDQNIYSLLFKSNVCNIQMVSTIPTNDHKRNSVVKNIQDFTTFDFLKAI